VLNELNDIPADIAAPTVKDLFFCVDSKSVVATAFRAGTDELCDTSPCKIDPAPTNLVFNRYGAGALYPILELSVAGHDNKLKWDFIC
jgi:hypothetical protein